MTDADLAFLRAFLRQRSGLSIGPEKRYLVESRLAPLAKAAGLPGLSELVSVLRGGRDETFARSVVDAMATHETLFFRDRTPFDTLRDVLLPQLAARLAPGRPLRMWSAAASTGQEAYSLAMVVREMAGALGGRPVEIVATDMSEDSVARARRGIYSHFEVQRGLPIRTLLAHFAQVDEGWQIRADLRAAVNFQVFNLLDDVSVLGPFDVILCRNLLIYLDKADKERLLAKLCRALATDGALCLGSAESPLGLVTSLAPHPNARGYLVSAPRLEATIPARRVERVAARAGGR